MGNKCHICLNHIGYKREKKDKPKLFTLGLESHVTSYLPIFFPQYPHTWIIFGIENWIKTLLHFCLFICFLIQIHLSEEVIKTRTKCSEDSNVFLFAKERDKQSLRQRCEHKRHKETKGRRQEGEPTHPKRTKISAALGTHWWSWHRPVCRCGLEKRNEEQQVISHDTLTLPGSSHLHEEAAHDKFNSRWWERQFPGEPVPVQQCIQQGWLHYCLIPDEMGLIVVLVWNNQFQWFEKLVLIQPIQQLFSGWSCSSSLTPWDCCNHLWVGG